MEPAEFSAFFSNLPSHDFNTLFRLLLPLANYSAIMEECPASNGHRPYFATGVPGSFFLSLFPGEVVFPNGYSLLVCLEEFEEGRSKYLEAVCFLSSSFYQCSGDENANELVWEPFLIFIILSLSFYQLFLLADPSFYYSYENAIFSLVFRRWKFLEHRNLKMPIVFLSSSLY